MDKSKLNEVIIEQRDYFFSKQDYILRDVDFKKALNTSEIVIISGIRRCGKSTLLKILADELLIKAGKENVFYLNFDDERLVNFTVENFNDLWQWFLQNCEKNNKYYFFLDEVQAVPYWEKWVKRLYEQEKVKVFVTGSNASLLSSEISTLLTGRNYTLELFPFSFKEFLILEKIDGNLEKSLTTQRKAVLIKKFKDYLEWGSFPQVLVKKNKEFVKSYFNDILYKDIIARYSLRDVKEIKEMAVYLASNIGMIVSYSTLMTVTNIKSTSSVKNYWDYFMGSFLFYKVNKFDYSVKKQIYNPVKNYIIDSLLAQQIGFNFSENRGRLLENVVFIHLKREGKEIYYHLNKKECDFVIKDGLKIREAIQICYELNKENENRELGGLVDALKSYKIKEGLIITFDQEKEIMFEGFSIKVVPIWKYLLSEAAR